jgi:hypothetical protein
MTDLVLFATLTLLPLALGILVAVLFKPQPRPSYPRIDPQGGTITVKTSRADSLGRIDPRV